MTRLQLKKKNSSVLEIEEVSSKVVPLVQLITDCYDSRVDLTTHKDELLNYFSGASEGTYSRIAVLLKRYERVELLTS